MRIVFSLIVVLLVSLAASPVQAAKSLPPLCAPQWTASAHPQGLAWSWNANPNLVVVLVGDNMAWSRGLHVVYQGFDRGPLSPLFGNVVFPPLLVVPALSGPVALSTCPLTLRVQGSDENGCDDLGFDDAVVTVDVALSPQNLQIKLRASGTVYWAVPSQGTIQVSDGYSPTSIAAGPFGNTNTDFVFSAATGFQQWGTSLGNYVFDIETDLPWLQLQAHGTGTNWIEVDMDHSCELQYSPLERPITSLTFWIPTFVGPWLPLDPWDYSLSSLYQGDDEVDSYDASWNE